MPARQWRPTSRSKASARRSVEHTIIRHDDLEAKNTRDAPDTVTPQKGDGARLDGKRSRAHPAAALLLDDPRRALMDRPKYRTCRYIPHRPLSKSAFGVASGDNRRANRRKTGGRHKVIHRTLIKAALVAAVEQLGRRGAGRGDRRLVGFPQRRRRRAHEEADRGLQRRARRLGQDRRHHPRMGRPLLRQGADLGRGRRGARRHDLPRQPHPARGQPGHPRRDHRRRLVEDGPRRGRLRTGHLGRGDGRRQAVRGAARYPPDRALLQQGSAPRGRGPRRRRPAQGHGQPRGLHCHAPGAQGRGRRVPARQRHRGRQLHVPHHLLARLPAGRRADDRRRVPDRRQRREARQRAGRAAGLDQRGPAVDLHRLSGDRRALHLRSSGDDDQRRLGGPDDDRPRRPGKAIRVGRRRDPGDLR